jgi:hypothetical protein
VCTLHSFVQRYTIWFSRKKEEKGADTGQQTAEEQDIKKIEIKPPNENTIILIEKGTFWSFEFIITSGLTCATRNGGGSKLLQLLLEVMIADESKCDCG